jgi:hypothetical protein
MTETPDDVTARENPAEESAEQQATTELVRLAKEQGLSLTGPDGLLKQLTKSVLESALAEEMTEHLGYEKHAAASAGSGNIRNGTRAKTVLTEHSGHVEIEVPRDRAATFEPRPHHPRASPRQPVPPAGRPIGRARRWSTSVIRSHG